MDLAYVQCTLPAKIMRCNKKCTYVTIVTGLINATGHQIQSFLINLGSNISVDKYAHTHTHTHKKKNANKQIQVEINK